MHVVSSMANQFYKNSRNRKERLDFVVIANRYQYFEASCHKKVECSFTAKCAIAETTTYAYMVFCATRAFVSATPPGTMAKQFDRESRVAIHTRL